MAQRTGTSIGFGGNEVIIVYKPLDRMVELVTEALAGPLLLEIENPQGDRVVINPFQIKVLQPVTEADDGS